MNCSLNKLIAAKVRRIILIMLILITIISPVISQSQSGTWVLADIRDDTQKNQDTEPYPYHNVAISTGNQELNIVNTEETWTDNRCNGHAESTSSWTQLPTSIVPGSILKVTTETAISGGQTCAEHNVGASTMMYVFGTQRLSNSISYWTSEPAPSPSVKISSYEVPEGRAGDQMEVLMIGGGPGGRLLRYYTYNWESSTISSTQKRDPRGEWKFNYYYGGKTYIHDMVIESFDPNTGEFKGRGRTLQEPSYAWTVSGKVDNDNVKFRIDYINGDGYYVEAEGVISSNIYMSGNAEAPPQVATWDAVKTGS
jgi:hypothetical protein